MTRTEYSEYRTIRKNLRTLKPSMGCTCTIRTNGSADYKAKLDALYTEYNMHPASVRVDSHWYDENERIIYIYGRDETFKDAYGRLCDWTVLYTDEERARFAAALTDNWNA